MGRIIRQIKTCRNHERGMILVAAIIVIVVMLMLATPFLFKLSAQFRTTEKSYRSLAAFNLAEEGIDRAFWEMNRLWVYEEGILALDENGNGTIGPVNEMVVDKNGQIEGTVTTNLAVEPNTRTIISTGKIPHLADLTVNRTVSVNLEQYFKSIFDIGIFADTQIYGRNNIRFDSYNSSGAAASGWMGHGGTNGTAEMSIEVRQGDESSQFQGNLAAGFNTTLPLTDVIRLPSEGVFVENPDTGDRGERTILSAEFEMPSVDLYNLPPRDMFGGTTIDFSTWFSSPPDVSAPLNSSLINDGFNKDSFPPIGTPKTVVLTNADSGVYTNFIIDKNANVKKGTAPVEKVQIQGHVAIYVTGLDGDTATFKMDKSTIEILPDSSLTLVLGKTTFQVDNNTFQNSSGQNGEGIPSNFVILGTDQFTGTMDFKNNVNTYAAMYVPRATVNFDQANFQFYGAIVCNILNMRNNTNIHYDEALKYLDWIKGGIPYWQITSWQERIGQD